MSKIEATTELTPIKPEVLELEKQISVSIKLDVKKGDTTAECTIDKETYIKNLPDGLTEDSVKAIQTYNTQLAAAAALAVGNTAIPAMKKHPELEKVSLTLPTVGKDYIGVQFDRSRQVPSRDENNVPNGTKTKFGSTSVEYAMYGTKSRGALKAVKELLAEKALEAFGK